MKLIFVRHGETRFGKEKRLEGLSDSPLTANGISQAGRIARFCNKLPIDKIYSSPKNRALQTAKTISSTCHKDVIVNNDLCEICYGEWDGKKRSVLVKNSLWKIREKNVFQFVHPGSYKGNPGESYAILFKRLEPFLTKLTKQYFSVVIIITHSGIIRCSKKYFEKCSDSEAGSFRVDNSQIYIVEWKTNKFKTSIVNL